MGRQGWPQFVQNPKEQSYSFREHHFLPRFFPARNNPMVQLVCYRREEKPREKSLAEKSPLTERYCTKSKVIDKQLMISELLVEAARVNDLETGVHEI
jgi:hypothetical protein